jgi:hypothetical protein
MFNNFFLSKNRAVCEIIWKTTVESGRPQMTIWRMCIARSITKATHTYTQHVILIACLLQQWLHERALKRATFPAPLKHLDFSILVTFDEE